MINVIDYSQRSFPFCKSMYETTNIGDKFDYKASHHFAEAKRHDSLHYCLTHGKYVFDKQGKMP